MRNVTRLLPAALIAGAFISGSATAAGAPDPAPLPACEKGKIFDKKKKACVQARSGAVEDSTLAAYAYQLAKADRNEEALAMLDLLQDRGTPEALNYRGYATRKLGRVEEGIGYYLASVKLDPDYTLVREYLGEAYVSQGRIDLARRELAEIEKRCGTTCEEYEDLAEAIKAAENKT